MNSKFMVYYHLGMGVVMLVLGVFLIVKPPVALEARGIPGPLLGGALLAYGGFRIWRGIRDKKRHEQREVHQQRMQEAQDKLQDQQEED